ncbi:MAG TPA: DUF2937 family protein [Solimonas sp.]|nr:DUF2937 family protein [Solimonas sp.]
MNLVLGLIDRLLFAAGLLLFLQLPQFIDQYTQRYAGYHQALADSFAEYQANADRHYGGDLGRLIADLRAAPGAGIREIGDKLERDHDTLRRMAAGLEILRHGTLWQKLRYLATDLDRPLAEGTWQDFEPGLPLSTDALLCGLLGALLASGLFNLLCWPLRRALRPRPSFA